MMKINSEPDDIVIVARTRILPKVRVRN